MEKSLSDIRCFINEPILRKLYDIERRINIIEERMGKLEMYHTKIAIKTKAANSGIEHPKPIITTIKNGFFINKNIKLNDVKLQWKIIEDVSRYIIEERCLSQTTNNSWYRSRLTEDYLKDFYILNKNKKFHENWSTIGPKIKITGMMGRFQWRYIPVYYQNKEETEGTPSKPSDIWESEVKQLKNYYENIEI